MRQEHVGGLDVAVDDAALVQVLEAEHELAADHGDDRLGQRPNTPEQAEARACVHELHHDPQRILFHKAPVVASHSLTRHALRQARDLALDLGEVLSLRAMRPVAVHRLEVDLLHGDDARARDVQRLEHLPETAAAQAPHKGIFVPGPRGARRRERRGRPALVGAVVPARRALRARPAPLADLRRELARHVEEAWQS